ncbi:MAG: hypothetical protein ACQEVA_01420 [Myxococcota bacterium]
MERHQSKFLGLWILAIAATLASLALAYVQLDDLPSLGVFFGPELTVRRVAVDPEQAADRQKFKRGDRLVALQGQSIENLRDLRAILENLPEPKPEQEDAKSKQRAPTQHVVSYQLVRPLYQFGVLLQGDDLEPTELPAGVEPTDQLVTINNQKLPTKVGPEAVRSITASRPDALLGFERENAVFQGEMQIPEPGRPYGVLICFGVALLVLVVLWRFRAESLHPGSALAVAFETLGFSWIAFLAFEYQWVMSDYAMASIIIISMALMRPFALISRGLAVRGESAAGWWALALGTFGAGFVLYMMHNGMLDSAEHALRIGAMIPAGFTMYELFVSFESDNSDSPLGEGAGYLTLIVGLSLFATGLAYSLEPVVFLEDRWRWFAGVILGLMWFGDLLFCLRGVPRGSYAEVATEADRHALVSEFLLVANDAMPESRLGFVMQRRDGAVILRPESGGLELEEAPDSLRDALEILMQEDARIPLPHNVERAAHPLGGIADTLRITLALRLQPPADGVVVEDCELLLLAIDQSGDEQLFRPEHELIDEIREMITAEVWTAALIEGIRGLDELRQEADEDQTDLLQQEVSQLTNRNESLHEQVQELEQLRDAQAELIEEQEAELGPSLPGFAGQFPVAPPEFHSLLEPQLVEALDFLLDDGEPIALAGAPGTGKSFAARTAARIEGLSRVVTYDAASRDEDEQALHLFGQDRESGDGLVDKVEGSGLLVEGAQTLSDVLLVRLCEASERVGFRLYLAFDQEDAEARSPLDGREAEVLELLEHREMVIPSLSQRPAVVERVLLYFLEQSSLRRNRDVRDFSDTALEALLAYDFPGELDQARVEVDLAVSRASDRLVRFDDLSLEVRQASGWS